MAAKNRSHAEYLQSAFADFERASHELSDFYQSLEKRVIGLTQALHASRSAEIQHLKEKEQLAARLSGLLRALPAGVVELAPNGTVVEFNPAASNLLNNVALGDRWLDVVQRSFNPRWDDGHDISLVDGRRVNIETAALGNAPGQILLIKDVTETRHLQDRLSHHQRLSAKTEVAAGLAHQVRTPLSTAILYLTNLRSQTLSSDERLALADKALGSMRDIEQLVEDMLRFARAGTFEMAEIYLQELVRAVVEKHQQSAQSTALELQLSSEITSEAIIGNREALVSVIINLIDNSRAAGANVVHLNVRVVANTVELRFQDDGAGVEVLAEEHLFEPFYSTKSSGNGLGLAIARSVARAHQGELIFDKSYDQGACFVLILPLIDALEMNTTQQLKSMTGKSA